jgi:hypothetical protein
MEAIGGIESSDVELDVRDMGDEVVDEIEIVNGVSLAPSDV